MTLWTLFKRKILCLIEQITTTKHMSSRYILGCEELFNDISYLVTEAGDRNVACLLHIHVCITVKPVCNDHLKDKICYLWSIQ